MTHEEKEKRFNEIYEKYDKLVWWHLHHSLVGDKADLEDVNQLIWMGIWKSVDKILPGKEHAFVYRVIQNQIKKYIYYRTRDRKSRGITTENSEGDEYTLADICKTLTHSNDFEYLELLDTIESALTEQEFEVFIEYFQGCNLTDLMKHFHLGIYSMNEILESIKVKLSDVFNEEATLPYIIRRKPKK